MKDRRLVMDTGEKCQASYYDERLAAWKVYLPVIPDLPVLAVGLDSAGLLSLARSWRQVHAWKCDRSDFEAAAGQAECQRLGSSIKMVGEGDLRGIDYHSIAVDSPAPSMGGADMLYGHLRPGGALVYIGGRAGMRDFSSQGGIAHGLVSKYVFLPSRDTKMIIPLAKRTLTRSGLNFYSPRKWHKRMAVRLAGLALRVGVTRLLGGKGMLKAIKPGQPPEGAYLFDWLGRLMGTRISEATVFIGNNMSLQRRITLQVFDETGRAVAVAKVGDTEHARTAALREAAASSSLGQIMPLRGSIPKAITQEDWQGHSVSVQEYVPVDKMRYSTELTPSHLGFLESLCRTGQQEMKLRDWSRWREIELWSKEGPFASEEDAEAARKNIRWCGDNFGGTKFVFHWVHGDFTHWNAMVTSDNTLMVFDWEFSTPLGLPFYDLVHFVLRKRQYFRKRRLSLAEIFSSTPAGLDVEEHISALSRLLPNFNNAPAEKRQGLLRAHLVLGFALSMMKKGLDL